MYNPLENDPSWPREITICPTDETTWQILGSKKASHDEMLWRKGWEMQSIEIESWSDLELPAGFEIWDEDEREEYEAYLEKTGKRSKGEES